MCCFSRHVERVSDTEIFARSGKDERQFIVYSMTLAADDDLAMILPLPVPKNPKEDAVRFINLEKYEGFFTDMHKGFAPKPTRGNKKGDSKKGAKKAEPKLEVVQVGSFEASFVPAVKDFSRLDERFRLPTATWDKLPQYADAGFAVFKLKKGSQRIHAMAFEFPRANPRKLFFPTVHIHDGKVHDRAGFDHTLYCQHTGMEEAIMSWEESRQPAHFFVKIANTLGIVDNKEHVYRWKIRGVRKNEDIVI